MVKKNSVGLFGYGCVGQGFYHTLINSDHTNIQIDKVCIRDNFKLRNLNNSYFTTDKNDILNNEDYKIIAELTDDPSSSFEIVKNSLGNRKDVVSANKCMIAKNLEELIDIQNNNTGNLLYDSSCAGSIPVIRTLEDYYQSEKIISVRGILNGTSNYILTKMDNNSLRFDEALQSAQASGFAESDPSSDISGTDNAYKTCIICLHSTGILIKSEDILTLGIESVKHSDIKFAKNLDSKIKLLSFINDSDGKFTAFVIPVFLKNGDNLFNVDYENNGLEINGEFTSKQLFTGKGAGSFPTGQSVLSDITALTQGYKYNYYKYKNKRQLNRENVKPDYDFDIKIYMSYCNEEYLADLNLHSVKKINDTSQNKSITGICSLKSIMNLKPEIKKELFICAFDPLENLNSL
ncbi:MAG TPA: homoserine dehydrogenase [Ignavibacteria bacterium]|nr:homoserine dehydrogenase [Ignavibacteria bacterium]